MRKWLYALYEWEAIKIDKNVEERIFQTIHKFRKISLNAKNIGDIPRSEMMMLKLIKRFNLENAGVTISTLSEKLEISKPAVSQTINALEDKGYVQRTTTKDDRRNVYVKLTAAGEQTLEKALQSVIKSLNQVLEEMGEEDTEALLKLLDKFTTIYSEHINR